MDSVARRIKNDHVRFLGQVIEDLKNVTGDKSAVIKTVEFRILSRCFHGIFHDLDTDHFFCHGCQNLSDRTGTGVEIKHGHVLRISDVIACGTVKHLSTKRVCLEEGERGDLETKPKNRLVKVILAIEDPRLIAAHHIRNGIIDDMQDSNDRSLQRQCTDLIDKRCQIVFPLTCRHEIHENFAGRLRAAQQQVAQPALMGHFMVVNAAAS